VSAVVALVKKELLEIVGDPYARRGGILQAGILTLVLGVLVPLSSESAWYAGTPGAITAYAFLPGVAAAAIAADAFAGERERRTLETLLATPLGETIILVGKAMAAVIWALAVATMALAAAIVTLNLSHGAFAPSPVVLLGAVGAAFASASFMASAAIVVSMLIPAARPAQQVASLGSAAIIGGGLAGWKAAGLPLVWTNVFLAEGAGLMLAIIVLEVARTLFRRDRFFGGA
jgi:ABC-2 type transport system permease protein